MNRQFIHNWKVSLFSLICLVTFINLGLWQMDRAIEKEDLLSERQTMLDLKPVDPFTLSDERATSGRPVVLHGLFETDAILLLDNRILDGKVGFEVHQRFVDQLGRALIVNRGFIPMGRTRDELLVIPSIEERVEARGRIYRPADEQLVLGDEAPPLELPAIVQRIEVESLKRGPVIYPHVIRLDEGEPGALPRHWPDTVMQPAQHRGYALQWFTMALAVAIVWLFFSFQSKEES